MKLVISPDLDPLMEKIDPELYERRTNELIGAQVFTIDHSTMYYLVRASVRASMWTMIATVFMVVCTIGGTR